MSSYKEGQTNQLANALEAAGFTPEDITKLGQSDNLFEFRGVLRGTHEIKPVDPPKPEPLLELVGTANVPARSGKFVARDHFVVDTSRKAKVKISYLGDNFREKFLGKIGKIEEPLGGTELQYHKLLKASVDGPILAELGGSEKAATTLAGMFSLMEKQPNGEDGILLTNGWWNIFYIFDEAGVVWAVSCDWSGGGWDVDAGSIESPSGWGADGLVFSRNS